MVISTKQYGSDARLPRFLVRTAVWPCSVAVYMFKPRVDAPHEALGGPPKPKKKKGKK